MNSKMKVICTLVLTMIVALALFATGCGKQSKTDTGDGFEVRDQQIVTEGDVAYITGTLVNTTNETHTIYVAWEMYGADKSVVGGATFNAKDIKAGEQRSFKEKVIHDDKPVKASEVKDFAIGFVDFMDKTAEEFLKKYGL